MSQMGCMMVRREREGGGVKLGSGETGMREMTRFACSHERGWIKDMKKLMRSGRCPCILETPFIASVAGFSKLIIDAALGLIIAAATPALPETTTYKRVIIEAVLQLCLLLKQIA